MTGADQQGRRPSPVTDGRSLMLRELEAKCRNDKRNSAIAYAVALVAALGFVLAVVSIFLSDSLAQTPLLERFAEMPDIQKSAISTLLGSFASGAFVWLQKLRQSRMTHISALALLLEHGVLEAATYLKRSSEGGGLSDALVLIKKTGTRSGTGAQRG